MLDKPHHLMGSSLKKFNINDIDNSAYTSQEIDSILQNIESRLNSKVTGYVEKELESFGKKIQRQIENEVRKNIRSAVKSNVKGVLEEGGKNIFRITMQQVQNFLK